jgi:thiamine-phosphate pyrophosphorylase
MKIVFPPLYAIIDAVLLKTSELSFAKMMAESGVELLQYRGKHVSTRELFDVCRELAREVPRFGERTRFIVNDRADVARLSGAGGVHVGQSDISVEEARAIVGPGSWVGVSTHTLEQVVVADQTSVDYIAFGPIFQTSTKEQPGPIVGLEGLVEARKRTSKPLVAIGGITIERAADVYRAGADSLAVGRDLIASSDPASQARTFLEEAARVSADERSRQR